MEDDYLNRFAGAIHFLLPDIGLTEEDIKASIQKHGYCGFFDNVGETLRALIETAELLSMPGKGVR